MGMCTFPHGFWTGSSCDDRFLDQYLGQSQVQSDIEDVSGSLRCLGGRIVLL